MYLVFLEIFWKCQILIEPKAVNSGYGTIMNAETPKLLDCTTLWLIPYTQVTVTEIRDMIDFGSLN